MSRSREYRDKIGDYEDRHDSIVSSIEGLKGTIKALEERLGKAESILKLIHYESNPAYIEGLKIKYEKLYGDIDER
tara:strand:+ start:1775 stop:2002 length:228 start_codon:yes stop_codon:yes gene_type:complete